MTAILGEVVISLQGASLQFDDRKLWSEVTLDIHAGEFIAVLGPNGSGKSSLLKVLLGLTPLTSGRVLLAGAAPKRGSSRVGYVPQQRGFDADLGARGVDLVALGIDGHRYGFRRRSRAQSDQIAAAIAAVGAESYATRPIGQLSGGEQQRLRIAQALLSEPDVLLCDEPLLSLDLARQREVVDLIETRRREANTAVIFVTHELNPVLPVVDRILYLVNGKWAIGTPEEVMTSESLTSLYGTPIDVVRAQGNIFLIGSAEGSTVHLPKDEHEHS